MPISRETASIAELSGGSNLATALSLNSLPYRATSNSSNAPGFHRSIEATTIVTRGLVGGHGTGTTHLATAIGVAGITLHGKRMCGSTQPWTWSTRWSRKRHKASRIGATLLRMDLVVLDELGYLPFSQAGGALLFHLLS
jgi:hypothetical protein